MKLNILAAAAALIAASAVQAATVGPGNLGLADNKSFDLLASNVGSFTNFYQFDVSSSGFAKGELFTGDPDVSVFAIGFVDSVGNPIAIDFDGSDGFSIATPLLAAGTYSFAVAGSADGGFYSGRLQTLIPGAVPEPETYALMLAGLGALAWVAKRRKTR
jgi:hypothetical protein